MKIRKIYISGKITGLPIGEVIAKFHAAEDKIRRFGFEPVSPLGNGLPLDTDWADHMGKDISLLLKSDAIYLLPDYDESRGAQIELCVALHQRMPVFVESTSYQNFTAFNVHTFEKYATKEA